MIAFFLMLCDHVGFMLIENGVLYGQNPLYWAQAVATPEGQKWYLAARILRLLGRMSFPLFAYFIVEGFLHTSGVGKYIIRMGFFAAVSEVPFDLACFGVVYNPQYQNVLITYFIALIALVFMRKAGKVSWLLSVLVAAPFCWIAWVVKCDYGALGVGLICLMYLLRRSRKLQLFGGAAVSAAESYEYYGISALSFLLLRCYNGQRGEASLKYFFYLMYPLHLAAFYAMVYFANR